MSQKTPEAVLNTMKRQFMSQIEDFGGIAQIENLNTKGWDKLISDGESVERQREMVLRLYYEIEYDRQGAVNNGQN
jgi:hypothetical protein